METIFILKDTKASKDLGFYQGNNYAIERHRMGMYAVNERKERIGLENVFVTCATIKAVKI